MKLKKEQFKMKKSREYNIAQRYHNRAKETERLSEKYNSMDKRIPFSKIKTQGDVSDAYILSARKWNLVNEYKKALKDYETAFKYAYNRKIQEQIRNKIKILENKISTKSLSLENLIEYLFGRKLVYLVISIFCFIFAIFLFSINITGNMIVNVSPRNSSLACLILFVCGIFFMFLYFIKK